VSRPTKPATVRFYFDADVLGLAKTVALRSDVTYPGDTGGLLVAACGAGASAHG
jgi:hypothetical protein